MKNIKFRVALSLVCLLTISLSATITKAAPIRLNQVVQTVNAKPGKAKTGAFTQLNLVDDSGPVAANDNDNDPPAKQQKRVIVTETVELATADYCECQDITEKPGGFPKWALLGLAAIPVGIILLNRKDPTPTPTRTTTPSVTPTTTPTTTPTVTPTPTPTTTPSITPTPEPVPEPMTILLFGTGLAGIGMAARRRMRNKKQADKLEE